MAVQMGSTPGHQALVRPAGFWIRVLAYIIDSIGIGIVVGLMSGFEVSNSDLYGYHLVSGYRGLVNLVVTSGYFVIFWSSIGGGQTLGMRLLKLKVLGIDGQLIDFRTSVIRYIGLILSFVVLLLGVIWVAFDPEKQGWHDKVARTHVVYTG